MQVSSSWPAMACAHPKGTAELSSLKAENKAPMELIFHLIEKDSKGALQIFSDNNAFGKTNWNDLIRERLGKGGYFGLL